MCLRGQFFVDDCIQYRHISPDNDQRIDRIATWENTSGMEFHPQKCSVMRISRARTSITFQYHLKGAPLAEKQSSTYLGWTYSPTNHGKLHNPQQQKVKQHARFPATQPATNKRKTQGIGFLHHGLLQPGLLL